MKSLWILWKSGSMCPCACVIPYGFSSPMHRGNPSPVAVFSASHRPPMPDSLHLTVLALDQTQLPDPLMEALPHSSTFTVILKTLHPPVTYRVALMPIRRPAHPFPSFPMMLHNKPATDYKTHPKIPREKPWGSHIQEPHKGSARDMHRTWKSHLVSGGGTERGLCPFPEKSCASYSCARFPKFAFNHLQT